MQFQKAVSLMETLTTVAQATGTTTGEPRDDRRIIHNRCYFLCPAVALCFERLRRCPPVTAHSTHHRSFYFFTLPRHFHLTCSDAQKYSTSYIAWPLLISSRICLRCSGASLLLPLPYRHHRRLAWITPLHTRSPYATASVLTFGCAIPPQTP